MIAIKQATRLLFVLCGLHTKTKLLSANHTNRLIETSCHASMCCDTNVRMPVNVNALERSLMTELDIGDRHRYC